MGLLLFWNGADVGLSITPGSGTLTITGGTAQLQLATTIIPNVGTLTLTGQSAAVLRAFTINPATGTITLNGYSPTVTNSGGGNLTLTPQAGAVTILQYTPTVQAFVSVGAEMIRIPRREAVLILAPRQTVWKLVDGR